MIDFVKYKPINWFLNTVFLIAAIVVILSWFNKAPTVDVVDVESEMMVRDVYNVDRTMFTASSTYLINVRVHYVTRCQIIMSNKLMMIDRENPNRFPFVHNYPLAMAVSDSGDQEYSSAFVIPDDAPPGDYIHVRQSFYTCGYVKHDEVWKPAALTIIAKRN
jgi:hypothetical protein